MTLVVNLFGGPGVGKSTTAALVFAQLKQAGVNCEIAHEYAKDLTWEDRQKALRFQPYVTTKQIYRVHRLLGEADVVITDSPILLALIYGGEGMNQHFEDFVVATFKNWNTLNYVLERKDYTYRLAGRNQTLEEARVIDQDIGNMLRSYNITHYTIADGGKGAIVITNNVIRCLQAS